MSDKLKKILAAAFVCIGGTVVLPQQITAALPAGNGAQQITAALPAESDRQLKLRGKLPQDFTEAAVSVQAKENKAQPAPDTVKTINPAQAKENKAQPAPDTVKTINSAQAKENKAQPAPETAEPENSVQPKQEETQPAPETTEADNSAQAGQEETLPAPETLEAVKTTYNAVTLGWSGVDGAAGYLVEYSADGKKYAAAGTVAADVLSFTCKKLLTGTKYQFRVCALDENGNAGEYASVAAQPYLNKTQITSISAVQLRAVSLEWKKVSGAEKYQLYRKTNKGDSYKLVTTTTETAYTDETVAAGETYFYAVRAVRKVNGKTVKAKLSAKAEASMVLPQMQIETCEARSYKSAKLTWQQMDNADGYYIYRSVSENGTYRKIKTIKKNTTLAYIDTGLVPGKKFYYKICTYTQAADKSILPGELSAPVMVKPQMDAPLLTAVNTNKNNRSLALAWEKTEHASGYRIYRSKSADKGFAQITELDNGSTVGYEDRAVTPGEAYYYRIKAVYANKSYKGLSLASDVLQGDAAPSAPIGLTIRQTATDVLEISWQESNGAQSYNLYRAGSGEAEYDCIAEGLAENHFTDMGLKDDKTYFYRVSPVGEAGEGIQCLPVSCLVGGVSMNTRTLKLCAGASKPLEISTFRQGMVIWKSADPSIAEVDSEGMVTGISYGTVNITATVAGRSASASVSVTPGSRNGIDVSRWQEDVDWQRVKNSGIEFAFLRITNHYLEDYTFETKYQNASLVGMPLGVYCYSRAVTATEAQEEARTVLKILNGRKLDYPIALDMEDAVHKAAGMTKENLHKMILAFKQTVEDAGYRFVLYSYLTFLNSNLDRTKLDGIDLWIARYRAVSLGTGYSGTGNQKFWQYNSGQYAGSDFHVDGITDAAGNLAAVDVNIEY